MCNTKKKSGISEIFVLFMLGVVECGHGYLQT